jgi:ATP-binding cassette, subfamily B, bacterial
MNLLWSYLKQYWKLLALALVLAAINQVFSLLDPLIFRHVIDEYAMRFDQLEAEAFYRGVLKLLGAAIGVAFVFCKRNCPKNRCSDVFGWVRAFAFLKLQSV